MWRFVLAFLLFCFSAKAQIFKGTLKIGTLYAATNPVPGAVAAPVPTMVQHIGGSHSEIYQMGASATNVHYAQLPELSLFGNALLLSYVAVPSAGSTGPGIVQPADDQTNTWVKLKEVDDGTVTHGLVSVWAAYNIHSNTHQVWITNMSGFVEAGIGVMDLSEWANVAAASAFDVGSTNFALGSSVTAGSITPSASLDLLYHTVWRRTGGPENSISTAMWTQGSQSDITWEVLTSDNQDGMFVQAGPYTNTVAINPQCTMRASTNYQTIVVALKASTTNQGSVRTTLQPQIISVLHQGQDNVSFPLTNVVQFPGKGQLRVLAMPGGATNWNTTNIVSALGNVYKEMPGGIFYSPDGQDAGQLFYCTNAIAGFDTLTMYYFGTSPGHRTIMAYDVDNAAALGLDVFTNTTGNMTVGLPATMLYTNCPLTPNTNNGFIFYWSQWAFNTAIGVTGPFQGTNFFDSERWDTMPLSGPASVDQNGGWAHFRPTNSVGTIYTNVWRYIATNGLGTYAMGGIAFNTAAAGSTNGGGTCANNIAFVQKAQQDAGTVQDTTKTLTNSTTAGNFLAVGIRTGAGGSVTITNLNNNTWTFVSGKTSGDGSTNSIWYCKNITGGTEKIGVHLGTGAATIRWAIAEFSGLSTTAPLDQASANLGTTSSALDSGNMTTTVCNELILGFGAIEATDVFTVGSGFTQLESVATKCQFEYRIVTGTGTYSASETTAGNNNWTMSGGTFK